MNITNKESMIEMNRTNNESWKRILREIHVKNTKKQWEVVWSIDENKEESARQPRKVIKLVKVPAWSKEMSLKFFEKQIKF